MSDTFQLLNRLTTERQELYFQAGKQALTIDQRQRLDELNAKIPILWDDYRRELASVNRVGGVPFGAERKVA